MNFRNYLPADEKRVREILISNIPMYFVMEDMNMLDSWLAAQNKGIVAYPPATADYFFVLEEGKKVIGCCGFYTLDGENRAHLTWGMLDSTYHNKGLGKLLFHYRANKIRELYPDYAIRLGTSQYTYQFFEKLGMKVESITPNGYGNGFDKYLMRLQN
jgi:[ribosomal protein S18]-alanine N-acetyltransferase